MSLAARLSGSYCLDRAALERQLAARDVPARATLAIYSFIYSALYIRSIRERGFVGPRERGARDAFSLIDVRANESCGKELEIVSVTRGKKELPI